MTILNTVLFVCAWIQNGVGRKVRLEMRRKLVQKRTFIVERERKKRKMIEREREEKLFMNKR